MKRWLPWLLCVAISVAAAVAVTLLVRRGTELREANQQLGLRVEHYCGDLAGQLRFAAGRLAERSAPLLDSSLSDEDRARAERAFDESLPLGAGTAAVMGEMTRHGRGPASLSLTSWFSFCAGLRTVTPQRRAAVEATFAEYSQRFRETEDREVIATSVAKMADAASEVMAWPLPAP